MSADERTAALLAALRRVVPSGEWPFIVYEPCLEFFDGPGYRCCAIDSRNGTCLVTYGKGQTPTEAAEEALRFRAADIRGRQYLAGKDLETIEKAIVGKP